MRGEEMRWADALDKRRADERARRVGGARERRNEKGWKNEGEYVERRVAMGEGQEGEDYENKSLKQRCDERATTSSLEGGASEGGVGARITRDMTRLGNGGGGDGRGSLTGIVEGGLAGFTRREGENAVEARGAEVAGIRGSRMGGGVSGGKEGSGGQRGHVKERRAGGGGGPSRGWWWCWKRWKRRAELPAVDGRTSSDGSTKGRIEPNGGGVASVKGRDGKGRDGTGERRRGRGRWWEQGGRKGGMRDVSEEPVLSQQKSDGGGAGERRWRRCRAWEGVVLGGREEKGGDAARKRTTFMGKRRHWPG
ncbi:hypothetical protein R3P38DRAFT_2784796 [Favolaschia claudopus]|uniref:Uncharacterized protein n=1 Tax=Favolaschia claudopus TaxID=2862362 RepID=A0AAW0AWK7_9AGAR